MLSRLCFVRKRTPKHLAGCPFSVSGKRQQPDMAFCQSPLPEFPLCFLPQGFLRYSQEEPVYGEQQP